MVHHETTTGRLNALADIGALGRMHGLGLLLDAVSSFGAEALDFEGVGVTACAATANKCLHGVRACLSFVVVSRAALFRSDGPRHSLYLNLQETLPSPRTAAARPIPHPYRSSMPCARRSRSWKTKADGSPENGRYRRLLGIARDGLRALGIEPLLPHEDCSVVLNAFQLPHGIGYLELHNGLKDRLTSVYAGQGDLATTVFRACPPWAPSPSPTWNVSLVPYARRIRLLSMERQSSRPIRLVRAY